MRKYPSPGLNINFHFSFCMSDIDSEEVSQVEETQLVVNQPPQAHPAVNQPVPETCLVQRYWRFGDTCPVKFSIYSFPPNQWPQVLLPQVVHLRLRQRHNSYRWAERRGVHRVGLRIRGTTLFYWFPKNQGWNVVARAVITSLHREEILKQELAVPIGALTITRARHLHFWYTRYYRHSYIPVLALEHLTNREGSVVELPRPLWTETLAVWQWLDKDSQAEVRLG